MPWDDLDLNTLLASMLGLYHKKESPNLKSGDEGGYLQVTPGVLP